METIKKLVDGEEYEFSKWNTKQSLRVLLKLSKFLGKPLSMAMGAFKGQGSLLERDIKFDVIGEAATALFNGMDENETIELIEQLTSNQVLCNGKQIVFNSHYEGKLEHLFKVVWAALEVQYGNFFGALSALPSGGISNSKSSSPPK